MSTHRQISRTVGLLFAGVLGITLLSATGGGQEIPNPATPAEEASPTPSSDRPDPATELAQLNAEMREVRSAALATRRAQLDRLKSVESELQAKKRTIARLEQELAKVQSEVSERETKLGGIEARRQVRDEVFADLKATISGYLNDLDARIARGIPWQIESRRNLLALSQQALARPTSGPAEALAILGRHQKDEEALGRLVEVENFAVDVPGQGEVAVKAVHLGLLGVIYANPEGSVIGFAGPGQKLEDGLALVQSKPEAADGYLQVIEILNRERTASLIDLYFPSLPIEEAK